ncbi:hypothetical protein NDU88_005483 [Pleurodeles waltl]|uniref:Uncharacterized protein n=1 Tax=Pleurodeles waltl TaxID=8319 RepID=A0AAV7SLU5_PLEWA|nr:hypothetical protein NDU88_005483 [Pleurodeles waltl]
MVKRHTPEPAGKCLGGTIRGIADPEVLPDLDIQVKGTERVEDGEPERKGSLEPEDGEGTELEDERRTETEEKKGAEPTEKGSGEAESSHPGKP